MRKEKAREEREKQGKGKRKMVTKGARSDCIVALSLSLSISLDFLELASIVSYLLAVSSFYSSILTFLLPCSAFTFFFAPEGTRSIFLGRLRRRSGWRRCSSTMQSMHSETKRQQQPPHSRASDLLIAHPCGTIGNIARESVNRSLVNELLVSQCDVSQIFNFHIGI